MRYCLILVFLAACTYEPEEIYFKEIIQPTYNVTISLNGYDDGDTIVLYGPASFDYHVSTTPGQIETVQVLFRGRQVLSAAGAKGTFAIQGDLLHTGTAELRIQFLSKSESGSYADKFGAEKFQAWRSWIIYTDVSPPPKPVVTASEENGFLKLSWTAYEKPNFVRYGIRTQSDRYYEITDPQQTSWIDSTYMGGEPVVYVVETVAVGSSSSSVGYNDRFDLSVDYRALDSSVSVKWKKTPFANAWKNYQIFENGILRYTVTNPEDTTLSMALDVLWNRTTEISVCYNAKYSSKSQVLKQAFLNRTVASRIFIDPASLYFNRTLNRFVGFRNNYLIILTSDLEPEDSVQISATYHVPFSGPFVYYAENNALVQHDLQTMERKVLEVKNWDEVSVPPHNISGSSNGLASYYFIQSGYHSRVYNFANETFIEKEDYPNQFPVVNPTLSDGGSYGYNWNTGSLRTVNAGTMDFLAYIGNDVFGFRQDNEQEVIMTASIYEITNRSFRTNFGIPPYYYLNDYDPVSQRLLYAKTGSEGMLLVHIETNESKKFPAFYTGVKKYRLVGGYLFDTEGFYVKVF